MTTTQGAIRRLELLLARTPDMECADDLRVVLADAVLSRRLLDDARALVSDSCPFVPQWATVLQKRYASFLADSAAPAPAQPAAKMLYSFGADRVIRKHTTDNTKGIYVAELIGWDAGLLGDMLNSAPGAHPPDTYFKQPAAVPEAVAKDAIREFLAADGATKQYEGKWAQPRQWKYNDPEMIRLRAARSALEALLSATDTEVKK